MARALAAELREFLYRHFESGLMLEALLLLYRRKGAWKPARLAGELDVSKAEAMDILVALHWQGFLEHEESAYRFAPRDAKVVDLIEQLAQVPRATLLAEIAAYSGPRSFAAAFRLRKDRKDG